MKMRAKDFIENGRENIGQGDLSDSECRDEVCNDGDVADVP
jgi:hypothetical protein